MDNTPTCCHIALPGRLESLPALSEFIADASRTLGIDSESSYRVQLAVEEACANVIQHGTTSAQMDSLSLTLDVCRHGQTCTVRLRDGGSPFDPRNLPPPDLTPSLRKRRPGGLGIFLIRRLMDEVSYDVGEGFNTLTMVKRLP